MGRKTWIWATQTRRNNKKNWRLHHYVTFVTPNSGSHLNNFDKHPRIKLPASGRGQQCTTHHQGTNPTTTKPRFAVLWQGPANRTLFPYETTIWKEAEQVFGIRRGQISLQFKYISKKFPTFTFFKRVKRKYTIIPTRDLCRGDKLKL